MTRDEADRPGSIVWDHAAAWTLKLDPTSKGPIMIYIHCMGQPNETEKAVIEDRVKFLTGRML